MSYQVFARKYRPRTFRELLGQDHVVTTLENAIKQDRLAHAYLFVGPRGTGKTSTARIFAKALNCPGGPSVDFDPDDPLCIEIAEGRSLDVLEIDGASNNGVEQVRELRETVAYAPASGKFKIYYIDEVHMLSNAAFNALLKTLEEPPAHVKFVFATTEAHKVLPTIISRCQRFDLSRIAPGIIADHLLYIAKEEGIVLEELAAHSIARGAEGGMRDAQSMLDQLVAFCGEKITEDDVLSIFGFSAHETIAQLSAHLLNEDAASALRMVGERAEAGKDLQRLLTDLIAWIRTLIVYGVDPNGATKGASPEAVATLQEQGGKVGNDRLLAAIEALAEAEANMRWAPDKKLHFEIAAVKACQAIGATSISDIIHMLGGGGGTGGAIPPTSPPPAGQGPTQGGPVSPAPAPTGLGGSSGPAPAPAPSAPSANSTGSEPTASATPTAETAGGVAVAAAGIAAATTPPAVAEAPPTPTSAVAPLKSAAAPAPLAPEERPSLAAAMAEIEEENANVSAAPEPVATSDAVDSTAAETAPSDPAPALIEAPVVATSDAEIWTKALASIETQAPLVAAWAELAHDLGVDDDTLTLGFAAENQGALESLERPSTKDTLISIVTESAGRPLKLSLIIKDGLAPIATVNLQDAPAPVAQAAAPGTPGAATPTTAGEGGGVVDAQKEDFYKDPLINDAVEIFSATLEERKKA